MGPRGCVDNLGRLPLITDFYQSIHRPALFRQGQILGAGKTPPGHLTPQIKTFPCRLW